MEYLRDLDLPRISVVMPTYNGSKFVGDMITSILEQTVAVDEIIIRDDGSQDGTIKLIEEFSIAHPRISLHTDCHLRLGVHKSFERLLSLATGDVIFLADQDDRWLPEKVERILSIMHRNPQYSYFIHDAMICDAELCPTGRSKLENIVDFSGNDEAFVMGACVTIRRELLHKVLPIPASTTYDAWIAWVSKSLRQRFLIEEKLILYRRHQTNDSSSIYSSRLKLGGLLRPAVKLFCTLKNYSRHSIEIKTELYEEKIKFLRAQILSDGTGFDLREIFNDLSRILIDYRNLKIADRLSNISAFKYLLFRISYIFPRLYDDLADMLLQERGHFDHELVFCRESLRLGRYLTTLCQKLDTQSIVVSIVDIRVFDILKILNNRYLRKLIFLPNVRIRFGFFYILGKNRVTEFDCGYFGGRQSENIFRVPMTEHPTFLAW